MVLPVVLPSSVISGAPSASATLCSVSCICSWLMHTSDMIPADFREVEDVATEHANEEVKASSERTPVRNALHTQYMRKKLLDLSNGKLAHARMSYDVDGVRMWTRYRDTIDCVAAIREVKRLKTLEDADPERFKRGCSNHLDCLCLFLLKIRDNPATVREQTFAALAPNAVGMIRSKLQPNGIEIDTIDSVVILGCGSGHSARAFSQLFQADVYGIDNQQYLLDEWNHEKDLLNNNQESRSVVSRIQLKLGDITGNQDSETMETMETIKGKLKSADLIFCWNSRLDDQTNNELFELVSNNIKQSGILVCTTLATIETDLVQNDDMRIHHTELDPQTEYTFTMGPG